MRSNYSLTPLSTIQLFHLITQEETQSSISVAKDTRTVALATKHDSTAMKTLAAVTVVFLPSTFISSFLAMPLFRWDDQPDSHSLTSRYFWVYWALSIPLTLLTVGVWLAWMRWQRRKQTLIDLEDNSSSVHLDVASQKTRKSLILEDGQGQDTEDKKSV